MATEKFSWVRQGRTQLFPYLTRAKSRVQPHRVVFPASTDYILNGLNLATVCNV